MLMRFCVCLPNSRCPSRRCSFCVHMFFGFIRDFCCFFIHFCRVRFKVPSNNTFIFPKQTFPFDLLGCKNKLRNSQHVQVFIQTHAVPQRHLEARTRTDLAIIITSQISPSPFLYFLK